MSFYDEVCVYHAVENFQSEETTQKHFGSVYSSSDTVETFGSNVDCYNMYQTQEQREACYYGKSQEWTVGNPTGYQKATCMNLIQNFFANHPYYNIYPNFRLGLQKACCFGQSGGENNCFFS